jgi:hypothetical protein
VSDGGGGSEALGGGLAVVLKLVLRVVAPLENINWDGQSY